MELLKDILLSMSVLFVGLFLLSILVGFRGGLRAGFRLFLFGIATLGVLGACFYLYILVPYWMAIIIITLLALKIWLPIFNYFTQKLFTGKSLITIKEDDNKWSNIFMTALVYVLWGWFFIIRDGGVFTYEKSRLVGVLMLSLGIIKFLEKLHPTTIYDKGILHKSGRFFYWTNIKSYHWGYTESKLSLKLHKALFEQNVKLDFRSSRYRREVLPFLEKYALNSPLSAGKNLVQICED